MNDNLVIDRAFCPHCQLEVVRWLPAEYLYTLDEARAALLIPTRHGMHQALYRHRDLLDPPRYAHGDHGRRYRMLTAREIRALRDRMRLTMARVARFLGISV